MYDIPLRTYEVPIDPEWLYSQYWPNTDRYRPRSWPVRLSDGPPRQGPGAYDSLAPRSQDRQLSRLPCSARHPQNELAAVSPSRCIKFGSDPAVQPATRLGVDK